MSFETLGLNPEILRAVAEQGYTQPTPIQQQAIPCVLQGRDLMASAQTGTGKTAGFTLPLLQLLSQEEPHAKGRRPVRALILTPTRELAAQVGENVREYSQYLNIRSMVVFGGVSINPQMLKLRGGVDVLVATPGRLLDLEHQNAVSLDKVEILVLDEADRMLDMGFIHDIRRVLAKLPAKRQNLLFSATFSDEIKSLASKLLHNPLEVEVARRNTASEQVSQLVHFVDKKRKRELLSQMIGEGDWKQVLVFTRTKHGANHLAEQLNKDGIRSAAIHGNKSQGARTRALADFKSGDLRVLVATDIAARGLDIEELPHVVNYELPNVPEDYVHRIGRTGRAAATGEALSLVCVDEHRLLRDIERLLKKEIPRIALEGYEVDPSIQAEPIQNGRQGGRGGRGGQSQGQPRRNDGGQARRSDKPAGNGQARRSDKPASGNGQARRSEGEQPRKAADGAARRRRPPRKPAAAQ
jgi:ATP-dependent RNA helicase RhlE